MKYEIDRSIDGHPICLDGKILGKTTIVELLNNCGNLWKPIETAPRDGTPVDLWREEGYIGFVVGSVWWTEDDCWSNVTDDKWYSHWRPIIGPNGEKLSPVEDEENGE